MTERSRAGKDIPPAEPPPEDVQIRRLLDRFGRNLVDLRALAGRSQMEVAAISGLHRTEIGLLENRRRMPGLGTVVRLAAGVGAEPDRLLDGLSWTLDPNRYQELLRGRFEIEEEGAR
ncbi:MAG TPA: helix-turn-helix transcriptional regulator [Solirubrobacterales bacterium]